MKQLAIWMQNAIISVQERFLIISSLADIEWKSYVTSHIPILRTREAKKNHPYLKALLPSHKKVQKGEVSKHQKFQTVWLPRGLGRGGRARNLTLHNSDLPFHIKNDRSWSEIKG